MNRRLGWLDLGLGAMLLFVGATRTPVGALALFAAEWASGESTEWPTLTATFSTGAAPTPDLGGVQALPSTPVPEGGFPEPARTAFVSLVSDEGELERLDALHAELGDPEQSLLTYVLGPDRYARASARAAAAGDKEPRTYRTVRRYLSAVEQVKADRLVQGALSLSTALDLKWPVLAPHRMSSPYGMRTHPTLGTQKFHNGLDLAVPIGTPIHSAQRGTVAVSSSNKTSGNYVIIDHGHGVRTSYCHLDESLVKPGQKLSAGELFAKSGNTGRSTGPHLHWIVRIAGETVDPARFRPSE